MKRSKGLWVPPLVIAMIYMSSGETIVWKSVRWNKYRHTNLGMFIEYSVLKGYLPMICRRTEDYLSCHHLYPYCLYGRPCCYNRLPKIPTHYESTKRDIYIQTYQTGIMYNSVFLSIRIFFSPHHQLTILSTQGQGSWWWMGDSVNDPAALFTLWISASIWTIIWNLPFSIFCWLLYRHSPCLFWNKTNESCFPYFSVKCVWSWH